MKSGYIRDKIVKIKRRMKSTIEMMKRVAEMIAVGIQVLNTSILVGSERRV